MKTGPLNSRIALTLRHFWPLALVLALILFAASACEYLEAGRIYAGKGAAHAVAAECGLSIAQRQANLVSINEALAELNHPPIGALDCDGDGVADF